MRFWGFWGCFLTVFTIKKYTFLYKRNVKNNSKNKEFFSILKYLLFLLLFFTYFLYIFCKIIKIFYKKVNSRFFDVK
jgi:hypothetical protein